MRAAIFLCMLALAASAAHGARTMVGVAPRLWRTGTEAYSAEASSSGAVLDVDMSEMESTAPGGYGDGAAAAETGTSPAPAADEAEAPDAGPMSEASPVPSPDADPVPYEAPTPDVAMTPDVDMDMEDMDAPEAVPKTQEADVEAPEPADGPEEEDLDVEDPEPTETQEEMEEADVEDPEPTEMPEEMEEADAEGPGSTEEPEEMLSSSPPPAAAKTDDGKYIVCVDGDEAVFGDGEAWRSSAITVSADGTCTIGEWAGGFDGYWNTDAGTSHEKKFARSVKDMLRDEEAEVGASAGRSNPVNKDVNAFMKSLREKSQPQNLDYPEDEEKADNGIRAENIKKASDACTEMISVQSC